MSELQEALDALVEQEREIWREKRRLIEAAPRTFEHLGEIRPYRRDRYVTVRADGAPLGYPHAQRPAAERAFKSYANQYGGNVFFYDMRDRVLVDSSGNTVDPTPPGEGETIYPGHPKSEIPAGGSDA